MGVDISEKLKIVFFQKWKHPDFRLIALEKANARVYKEKKKIDQDLVLEYADKTADEMSAGLASCLELLGKFNVELFKFGRLDSMSISDEGISDILDEIRSLKISSDEYCPVLTATIEVQSSNFAWLHDRGIYMLQNGLTKNDMRGIEHDDENSDSSISDLAKKFCCAIEYKTQEELNCAAREVFMFDGSKVLEENTTYNWEGEGNDMQVIPENKDFMKKSFEDVIIENYPKTVINIDVNQDINMKQSNVIDNSKERQRAH